jgi:ubiquinone/menaquinone biosynthesis C-methylase UbiE
MSVTANKANATSGYTDQGRKVAAHWSRLAVTYEGAIQSLEQKGLSIDEISAEDLHALDMLHMGGLAATDELATMAGIASGDLVLDVGCGVGGPARRFANKFGATVWGLDLSETLLDTATKLTALVGLQEQVKFRNGSALSLPFDDRLFDAVFTQHVAMQISEKERLFVELTRVVKPGGCLAMHEIFGGEGELHYPLAWATEPSMSALETLSACTERLAEAGFDVGNFVDHSEHARKYHQANIETFRAALDKNEGALGLSTEATEARMAGSVAMERNLRIGSLKVGMLVSRKEN